MQITVSAEMNASVDRIFRAMNDEEEVKRWSKLVTGFIYEKEEDRNQCYPGLTYICVQKQFGQVLEVKARVVECNLPHRLAARAVMDDFTALMSYSFDKHGEVVRVTHQQEYEFSSGMAKVLFVLTSWISRIMLQNELNRLKKYVEAHPHLD